MEDPWADAPPSPRPDQMSSSAQASTSSPLRSSTTRRTSSPPASPTRPSVLSPPAPPLAASGGDEDDEFDDFDNPDAGPSGFVSAAPREEGDEDGFGDFGDFEEGDFDAPPLPSDPPAGATEQLRVDERWQALRLRPVPPRLELLDQLKDLLGPLGAPGTADMSDEPLRQVGGLRQIMISRESQDAYVQLNTPPMLKPLDWTRSRVRREHLISMGVPVNLDEVDSHKLSAMPPIRVSTGSMGPPPVPLHRGRPSGEKSHRPSVDVKGKQRESSANGLGGPIVASPATTNGNGQGRYGLGEAPEVDMKRAEDLCGLEEDQISLMPLAALHALQADLVEVSAQASGLLAWQLQLKDAQTHDSATYNGMISELIANAAKAKSAQQAGSGGVFRSSSVKKGRASGSGTATPRTSSPAIR